jgi:TonB-linked SusC/RagA family outer membrane protein
MLREIFCKSNHIKFKKREFMEKRLFTLIACLFLSIGMALAQVRVTGVVVSSEDGEPIIGAAIRVVGSRLGTASDADGHFSISVPKGSTLEVSYIGMASKRVAASSNMRIVLTPEENALDELVVTGYGSTKKLGTIAGSVETVSSEKFENRPVANIGDALQGQVAGLQVFTSSGEPSASVSMRIRGVTSINASTTPLYILDGSEITSSTFQTLNPNDIENMTVLKDASATAVYGSRAANGVIILTSKKGKYDEKPSITVTAQYGISKSTGDHADMMNAEQWLNLQELITPAYKTDEQFQAMKNYYVKNGISTDWSDVFFGGSAPTTEINASVRGGSKNTSYLTSFSHYKADGIMDDSNMRRETARVNLETKINDWLKIGTNNNLSYSKTYTTAFGSASNSVYNKVFAARTYLPIETYYEVKGLDRTDYANSTFEGYGERKDYFDLLGFYNPYYLSEIQPSHSDRINLNDNVFVNINPIKGLNIRSALGLEWLDYRSTYTALPTGPFEGSGTAQEGFERYYKWTITNTAEYKFSFLNKNEVTVLAGHEYMYSKDRYYRLRVNGLTDTRLTLPSAGSDAEVPSTDNDFLTENKRLSWFGTLNYSYDDKYFVDLSIRRDGSSLFGENNRWGTFGAAAAMWNISKESFMEPTKSWLNDLAVKVSYGSVGNSGIDPYLAYGLVSTGPIYNAVSGTAISNPSNPDLTWETVKTFNVALTGRILNRISFDFEYYNKVTSDMLMSIPYSFTTGFSSGYGNVAEMRNRGFDFDVKFDIIKTKDWYWNISINGNYNSNKITKLFQGLDSYTLSNTGLRLEVGHPYGEFYYVRWSHVDPRDGQNVWLDKNGNETKVYSDDDAVMTGKNEFAPWSGGMMTTLSWKGLQLDLQFTGMFNRYMMNNERYFSENARFASQDNQSTRMLHMWTTPGQITDIPAADADVEFDTHLLEDASFVRLKMLQLSYTLPKSLVRRTGIVQDAKVFFIGRNLLTFTGYDGYDPEVNSNITLGNYPNTRQYSFGLQVTF